MSVVEFSDPIQAGSIMPFGTSGVRHSPHFFDQAKLFSSKQLKSAWFSPEEVAAHAKSTIVLTR